MQVSTFKSIGATWFNAIGNADAIASSDIGTLASGITSYATYTAARDAFVIGCTEAGDVRKADNIGRDWRRLYAATGAPVPKCDSPAAKRMAESRAAKGAQAPESEAGDVTPTAPVKGALAAAKIKMELSTMESHIISLIRSGKFAMAAQCVADMNQAAPV